MGTETTPPRTVARGCPLCEASCGLHVTLDTNNHVLAVRGNPDDVYSHGFLCPKGASLGAVEDDPDRLVRPLVRRGDELCEVSWDEAFEEIDRLLTPLLEEDRNSVATFRGNSVAHNFAFTLSASRLPGKLGSIQTYSSSTMDHMPQVVAAGLLFGEPSAIPVVDLDHTDLLVIIGGNPMVSNGSVGATPDYRGILRRIHQRGGKLVVIDPARTATAAVADQHLRVRPGTDLFLLLSLLHTLFDEALVRLGRAQGRVKGLDVLRTAVLAYSPETVAEVCGVPADVLRQLARDLAKTERAAVYGRLGTTLNRYGTLTCWALQLVNILCGNLDTRGGLMFPMPITGSPTTKWRSSPADPMEIGRYKTRVRGYPKVLSEMPVAALAEEILTPGPGRVRALVTYGGNVARSIPNSGQMQRALEALDALICFDPYLNETTRHAHVILPSPGHLTRDHCDILFFPLGRKNWARFSEAARALPPDAMSEWEALLRLCGIYEGRGPNVDTAAMDDEMAAILSRQIAADLGLEESDVVPNIAGRGPRRLLDLMIRSGPYGDLFGHRHGLTLAQLMENPNGIDLGPLEPRLNDIIRTSSGHIDLAPAMAVAELRRVTIPPTPDPDVFLLIGRRDLRSKNSWLHNIASLSKGDDRSALYIAPADAARLGVRDASLVTVRSSVGEIEARAKITDEVGLGVVSLGHGWGHDDPHTRLRVAAAKPGVNSNTLTDNEVIDPLSGTVELNAVPVRVMSTVPPNGTPHGPMPSPGATLPE